MAELFNPCSPVHRSPTPLILTSLAAVCTSADSLVATRMSDREFHQNTSAEHAIQAPFGTSTIEMHQDLPEQTLLRTMTLVEDVVLVEDTSDDEEAILDAHWTIDDPIFLITIEDNPSYSMVEVKVEEAHMIIEDPLIEVMYSPFAKVRNGEELGCPPTHTPSPPSTIARRRCKSYNRPSLHRSACVSQRNVLKDLGILGNDGKLNEDVIQDYADRLKKLLPPDDLKPLMDLKGHAFLELLAELSLSLC
ncbi:hypothetical protein SETIT_4G014800v2 [Setaria italica]|uniref:Uncharacterized protein n=1 Tax=Setaria italica TaxID=4555 RepID=A0A368QPL3_SETIT|nr:hypothetical protein SETIT_4G014800v2 [Setaria italica]